MIYTDEQLNLINEAKQWWRRPSDQLFQYTGYAGTGKSVVLFAILEALGVPPIKVAPMSYVGQAAIVMRLKGLLNAKTIHSWLYEAVEVPCVKDGKPVMDYYFNKPKTEIVFMPKMLDNIDLIFNDEAGTTPEYMAKEILSRGIKVIAAGDLGQLPPIEGKPGFLVNGDIKQLTTPMRQNENSPIYYLATRARKGLPIYKGYYGPNCIVIDEDELTDDMLAWAEVTICGKNSTRDAINKKIRHDILGIKSDFPVKGEQVMCRKNNWEVESDGINLANGLLGTVVNSPGVDGFDGKTLTIDFKPKNINTVFQGIDIDFEYLLANAFQRNILKNNRYSVGEKFEYANAITCHSSQGGQFRRGIYLEEYLSAEIQNNLNYTGITRFSDSIIYVKKKRKISFFSK